MKSKSAALAAAITFGVSFGGTLTGWFLFTRGDQVTQSLTFSSDCLASTALTNDTINGAATVLLGLSAFASETGVTDANWSGYADFVFANVPWKLAATSFLQYVTLQNLSTLQNKFRLNMTEVARSGSLVPAGNRSEYMVITKTYPTNRALLGYDFLSSPILNLALRQSQKSREIVVSQPTPVLLGTIPHFRVVFIYVTQLDDVGELVSAVTTSIDVNDLIPAPSIGQFFRVTLENQTIFTSEGFDSTSVRSSNTISVFNKNLLLECATNFVSNPASFIVLGLACLMSLVVTSLVYFTCVAWHRKRVMGTEVKSMQMRERAASHSAKNKSVFLATVSHEIRTPLNGIMGMLALLEEEGSLNAKQADLLHMANQSAARLLTIVNDILDFSKIDAGKMTIEKIPFDVGETLQSTFIGFSSTSRGIEMRFNNSIPEKTFALGDPCRIQQVLSNFLGNAKKFTESGSIDVTCTIAGDVVRVDVTDTGIGMTEEQLELLAIPFTQANTSTTRIFGGTGLGLSICKRLLVLMGGRMGVSSRFGRGSTFWFEVPYIAANPPPAPAPAVEILPPSPQVKDLRVMVVEDNVINQKVAVRMLQLLGHSATLVTNGLEAVQTWVSRPADFDVVLMDVMMPVMDGYAATRAIRASGGTLPIVAMTANVLAQEKDQCIQAGMDDFVLKPFTPATLSETLARVMTLRFARRGSVNNADGRASPV